MTVYQIYSCDFQNFIVEDKELSMDSVRANSNGMLAFRGGSKADMWIPPAVRIYNPLAKRGSFFGFTSTTFAVSAECWEKAGMFLEMAGEVLPLPYKGEQYGVFNCTKCINCLDGEKSEWKQLAELRMVRRPAFKPDLMSESTIFKIPEQLSMTYCYEDTKDTESEFKAFVESEGLEGIKFVKIWSDEE